MNFSLIATIFIILGILFSGVLSALSLEVGIFSVCFLLGGLCEGPAMSSPPGSISFL